MEIHDDDILDAFIKTATGGFAVNKDPRFAEVAAEQRRRYREAFAALPLSAALPADVIATARKYNELPAPEHLAAGNLAHLNLASVVGERVIGLIGGVSAPVSARRDDSAIALIRRKRIDAETPGRDGLEGINTLRGWLRRIHMELVGGWDQDTPQERIAELLGEHPRGHAREFKVAPRG